MHESRRDLVAGAVCAALAAALLVAIPHQVVTLEAETLTPGLLPTLLGWTILLLGGWLMLGSWLRRRLVDPPGEPPAEPPLSRLRTLGLLAAIGATTVGYVLAMPVFGYLLTTAAALALLGVIYGLRDWKRIALLAILVPPLVYAFFRYAMVVLLPQGSFFS